MRKGKIDKFGYQRKIGTLEDNEGKPDLVV